jgi:cytochrome c-type biogenesis protein CcmH/NrfG
MAAASTPVELVALPAYVSPMSQSQHERDEAQRREALATLDQLREGDTFASSVLARTARRAGDHFAAKDAGAEDRVELWGRRIGRALSLAGLVALAIYLYFTYFAK